MLIGFYFLISKKFILSYFFFVLSILTRPLGDLIFPFIILYFLIFIFKFNKRKILINILKYLAIYFILMTPWWYHNYIKYDKFVRLNLSTNFLLYVGNNKNNKTGGGVVIDRDDIRLFPERFSIPHSDYNFEIFRGKPGFEVKVDHLDHQGNLVSSIVGYGEEKVDPPLAKDIKGVYDDNTVRRKKGIENFLLRDSQFKKEAIKFIKNNPKQFFKNALIKFKRFWSPIPFSQEYKQNLLFKNISFLSFSLLLFFSLIGAIMHRNWFNPKLLPFYVFIIYINLVHMVLISSIRYRFVIEWIMILTASYSINFLTKKFFNLK